MMGRVRTVTVWRAEAGRDRRGELDLVLCGEPHQSTSTRSFETMSKLFAPQLEFVDDPRADIVLQSSDGVSFAIRRVHLQSSCEVFDGMLSIGTDEKDEKHEKDEKTGLPVVKLQDIAKQLDIFLRFIDRDQTRLKKTGEPLTLDETMSFVRFALLFACLTLLSHI
jgi:hypothetical protein